MVNTKRLAITSLAPVLALTTTLGACTEPDPALGPVIETVARVQGVAYIDLNGTGALDVGDNPLAGLRIEVLQAGTETTVASAQTDTLGAFSIDSIPTGRYGMSVDVGILGDSLELLPISQTAFSLGKADTLTVAVGVGYPFATLEEVRSMPPGRKVSTTGFALNSREPFGDGAVHLRSQGTALRATNVERANVLSGDSVRFLGWTATQNGLPILDNVQAFVLTSQATRPLGIDVGSGEARQASGGSLDAELVTVREAEISDTATVSGDFLVTADDGSGPILVKLRSFLGMDLTQIVPGNTFIDVTGLLVSDPLVGDAPGTWHIQPRNGGDLRIRIPVPNS